MLDDQTCTIKGGRIAELDDSRDERLRDLLERRIRYARRYRPSSDADWTSACTEAKTAMQVRRRMLHQCTLHQLDNRMHNLSNPGVQLLLVPRRQSHLGPSPVQQRQPRKRKTWTTLMRS
jgi:hypothetical protein